MLNQLARYGPVVALVEDVDGSTMLEVGSGSRGCARFLSPRWSVTTADLDYSDYGSVASEAESEIERVVADVCDLPFEDESFDVVTAVDLVEHVPASRRGAALAELARVTKRRLIVAVPTGEPALAADRRLADVYRSLGAELPVWLREHLENGFPRTADLEEVLEKQGSLRMFANESVAAHERIAKAEAMPRGGLASALLSKLFEPLVRRGRARRPGAAQILSLLRGGDREPRYRTIAVLDRS